MISAGGLYPIAFDVLAADQVTLVHATTVTLTVSLPDGTTATPAITDSVTGQYRLSYQTTIPGRYTAHAVTTGPVTSWDDEWDVAPAPWPAIISLADAKSQLHIDLTDHTLDDLLRDYLAAITSAAEEYKHEVIVRRTVTDLIDAGGGWSLRGRRFRIWSAPIISLTSVVSWDGLITWDVSTMRVSPGGVVRVLPSGVPVTGLADVTYLAGYQQVPGRYRRGALVMLEHVWGTQRGASLGQLMGGGSDDRMFRPFPGEIFTIPNRAKEWFGPPRPVVA